MLGILRAERVFLLSLQHHGQVATILVNIVVPVDHGLILALHSLDHAVSEKLVVISEQSRSLFRFHIKRPAESIQNEF